VSKGSVVELSVKQVFTHLAKPFPKEVDQAGELAYEYRGNVHFLTPYITKEEVTIVKYFQLMLDCHQRRLSAFLPSLIRNLLLNSHMAPSVMLLLFRMEIYTYTSKATSPAL
jgi:Ribophorin I